MHDPKFGPSRNRAKTWTPCKNVDLTFWQNLPKTSLQPIFHGTQTVGPELRDASVLALCLLMQYSEFVVDFVQILTEVGKFGEMKVENHGVLF